MDEYCIGIQNDSRSTHEKRIIANTTKYATLASNGLAVLSECMIVVVPLVIVNNLMVRITLNARKIPI